MFKRSLILCGFATMLLAVSSCIFDPSKTEKKEEVTGIQLEDLTQKSHVLNNIEYAYKYRNTEAYDNLVGDQFTFFFAPGDVGGEIPEQWDAPSETGATGRLFLSNQQDEDPICRSIRLDLDLENIQWVEVIPEAFPDEVWYSTFIFYTFTFEMEPDQTYIAQPGAKAQFTVRNEGTASAPHWQLVEFRDLGNS